MKIIYLIPFCLFTIMVKAQDRGFSIGLEGGAGASSLIKPTEFRPAPAPASLMAITFGAFLQYDITSTLSLRTGAYYERKGYQFALPFTDITGATHRNVQIKEEFHYVNIPLLVRATFGPDKFRYFLNAGPYLGILSEQSTRTGPFLEYPETITDNTDDFESMDLGFAIGAGLSYALSDRIALSLELRNYMGLQNLQAEERWWKEIRLNSTHALLGISFRLGRHGSRPGPVTLPE